MSEPTSPSTAATAGQMSSQTKCHPACLGANPFDAGSAQAS